MLQLEHAAEKWKPVFRNKHAKINEVERSDDSSNRHEALITHGLIAGPVIARRIDCRAAMPGGRCSSSTGSAA